MKTFLIVLFAMLTVSAHATTLKDLGSIYVPFNAINWKVGDYTNYDLTASFGNMGTMTKVATSEQGNAVWIKSDMNAMGQKQSTEMLIDRGDGHIVEYRENGQQKPVPDSKLEIISEDADTITVPAGTFETIHIKAKQDGKNLDVWMNPSRIKLDGMAQATVDTGMFPITLKLTAHGSK